MNNDKAQQGVNVNVDRQFFAELLNCALSQLVKKSGTEEVFAAPLGGRVKDLLRIRLQNPDANLNGAFFGPILYPELPPVQQSLLKFRHFLAAFPQLVEVVSDGLVDKVKLANSKPFTQSSGIVGDIITVPQNQEVVASAYLIIDSPSFLDHLHHIVTGEKLSPKTLPNWDQLRKYLQEKFPAKEWKARFMMGMTNAQNDSAGRFREYLESISFRVIQFKLESQPSLMDTMINERSQTTASAVSKLLTEIGNNINDAHVFAVTHTGSVAGALGELLTKRRGGAQIGVIGFPERMDAQLLKLRENGLVMIDIESEAKVFKTVLPRRQHISPNDFNPADYL